MPTWVAYQTYPECPDQCPGDDEQPVPALRRDRAEDCRDHSGDQRRGDQRHAGAQDAVAPDVGQPQDVGQQVGVEAHPGCDRGDVAHLEGADLEQLGVQQRRAVAPGAEHEEGQQQRGDDEAADDGPARPAPLVPLDDPQGEQPEGEGEQRRPAEVRQGPAPRCPALDERAPGDDPGGDPEGKVHEERPAPVTELHEQAADRRAEAGRQRGRRAPQPDGVGPALGGERRDDQRQARPAPAWPRRGPAPRGRR